MSVDITCLTQYDSVTVNMSVWSADELITDSIVFTGEKRITIHDFETFFIEKDKKLWLHRYSVKLSFSDLTILYSSTRPYNIFFYDKSISVKYGYPIKQWEKEKNWMDQVIHIITTNKRLNKRME